MAGQRKATLVSLPLGPGVLSNTTPRGAKTRVNYMTWDRWRDSNCVRWHKGLPEKIGGWVFQSLGAMILGVCRGLHDWASNDNQLWMALGTNLKLYLYNNQMLIDITPARQTDAGLSNPFATTNGSATVVVTDAGHGANTGDYVTVSGSSPDSAYPGGYNGEYTLTVIDNNTYSIVLPTLAAATLASTGGTGITLTYDISVGVASNSSVLLGYGVGTYGSGTYGTPRTGSGELERLRTWSLQNYGQDLIASYSDGGIYWWQRANYPATVRAGLLTNSPSDCQRVIAQSDTGFIIAYGCTDLSSNFNPMLVRWSDNNNITIWTPAATNNAGNYQLQIGSRIVTAIRVRQETLIFTDTHMYRQVLTAGSVNVFSFYPLGSVRIAGPNAVVEKDGIVYIFGIDNIYVYEGGAPEILPCEVWETVFDNENGPGLLRSQTEMVYASTYEGKSEIQWNYPSNTGPGQNDSYVTFNFDDQVWYYGQVPRSAMHEASAIMSNQPYGTNNGYLYQHEVGIDAAEPGGTVPIGWWMQSLDITTGGTRGDATIGGSDARFAIGSSQEHLLCAKWIPDYSYLTGMAQITIKTKERPQQTSYAVSGPAQFSSTTKEVDLRAQGSQIALRLDNYTAAGGLPSLGSSFRMGIWQALATPYGQR